MTAGATPSFARRIYPLSPKELTEEQLAVVCAMTSRRPEPFDEIAQQVSQEKAADFHERWVLGYGHASVAEHAVLHMAVENISRLACDSLEDNRLASYTEKSSRFQVLPQGYYHVPAELDAHSELRALYIETCDHLFETYESMIEGTMGHLRETTPQRDGERDSAYNLRLRRLAIDSCRFILPASTLTNVGVTMNARVMEHAISKLLSSELSEEHELGEELKEQGQKITPTLIKYADESPYLKSAGSIQRDWSVAQQEGGHESVKVDLVDYDPEAEKKLAAVLLYRFAGTPYSQVWTRVEGMDQEGRQRVISACLDQLGPHDPPVRELELVDYTFEMVMDYGAYREFKRHRMQTYIPQPLTVANGFLTPDLLREASLEEEFVEAMGRVERVFGQLSEVSPDVAQYVVTHAHLRRLLSRMNLRECYHLFKLRTQPQAHFSIRKPMIEAMRLVVQTQPGLFRHLKLREFPDWWGDYYRE